MKTGRKTVTVQLPLTFSEYTVWINDRSVYQEGNLGCNTLNSSNILVMFGRGGESTATVSLSYNYCIIGKI